MYYAPGFQAEALAVAQQLHVPTSAVKPMPAQGQLPVPNLNGANVLVVVGSDLAPAPTATSTTNGDDRDDRETHHHDHQGRLTPAAPGGAPADRWAPWRRRPQRAGVLSDFDGTLAPIVADPAAAEALPGAAATLARLAARYGRVAVISGRPVAYLAGQFGTPPGLVLVGLYGLERLTDGVMSEHPDAHRWRAVVDRVAEEAAAAAPPGVHVEHKGLSVTLHTRRAPAAAPWVDDWAARAAAATGLLAEPGRRSVELRPPVDADKGTVLAELAADLDAVCFLGDDRGDLPAFDALRRLAARGLDTVAVAVDSDEAPAALVTAADVVVEGPSGALRLLESLAGGP